MVDAFHLILLSPCICPGILPEFLTVAKVAGTSTSSVIIGPLFFGYFDAKESRGLVVCCLPMSPIDGDKSSYIF